MKSPIKNLTLASLTVATLIGGIMSGISQTTLTVDSTRSWVGYMNVSALPADGGGYQFGSAWGTVDLRAAFDVTGTNYVTITPNTNVWETTDTYWVKPDGVSPNKNMDASFYVQNDALAGQTVTFQGTCISNTLVSPYTCVAFIKDFTPSYSANTPITVAMVTGQPFSITLATTAGDHIQYGFETIGPDANPTTLVNQGVVKIAVNNADPSLSAVAGQALVEGQNANFTVTARGTAPFSYQWSSVIAGTTNALGNGAKYSGATTNALIVSNVVPADIGAYFVTVTNARGSVSAGAPLVVIPLAQYKTNQLLDPGFESGLFATTPTAGWVNFGGSVFANTNEFYFLSATPISVVDGTNCLQVYAGGSYNGAYQDRPASPGQVFTAKAFFLTPSADQITGSNVCYLEIQFRDAGDNPLAQYSTTLIDTNFPADKWISLVPTNKKAGDFTTPLGTSGYMVAPTNTTKLRYQITYHSIDGVGSVYADAMDLTLRSPVVSAAPSGSNIQLSFATLYGPTYQVLYKTNLTDANWTLLTTVTGDGTVKTVADPMSAGRRFYIVNTQ